ncbi:MAG: hypothetical protein AAF371_14100 [Pseudomonadota bacterium]
MSAAALLRWVSVLVTGLGCIGATATFGCALFLFTILGLIYANQVLAGVALAVIPLWYLVARLIGWRLGRGHWQVSFAFGSVAILMAMHPVTYSFLSFLSEADGWGEQLNAVSFMTFFYAVLSISLFLAAQLGVDFHASVWSRREGGAR